MTKPNQYLIIVLLIVTARGAAIPANADEETLAASPATSYRRSPDWDPARAAAIRERWHRFVRRVLDLD